MLSKGGRQSDRASKKADFQTDLYTLSTVSNEFEILKNRIAMLFLKGGLQRDLASKLADFRHNSIRQEPDLLI